MIMFPFLHQRWFFSLLGLLALMSLVWFLGPLWSPLSGFGVRLAIVSGLAGAWLAWWGLRRWQTWRRGRKLAAGIAEADDSRRAAVEEEAVLQKHFREALGILQRSRFQGQKLYQLPWYVLIGPPGAGKTTLLVNSDLHFPLSERFGREALRGVGGTRHCDWWFAEEAVLLDTAGRYTTQESRQAVDRSTWLAFLGLLKKHRPRRPLNGVIVVIGMADLTTQDETARHAQAIRRRIQELYQRLGVRLPVYVVINKSDLLAGFDDYFNDLTPEERNQVWGMTFPWEADGKDQTVTRFKTEFRLLGERLHDHLNAKLARETNRERRERIYLFPHQFDALGPLLDDFLTRIFRPSHFEEPVWLRGVYFTSATQEGSPIDRILSTLAQTFHLPRETLPRFSGTGRAFFINDLLRRVIFAEAGLAGTDRGHERRSRYLWALTLGSVAVVALGLAGLWGWSSAANYRHAQRVLVASQALRQAVTSLEEPAELSAWLPILDQARQLTTMTHQRSWRRNFGLSQDDKLAAAARSTYTRLLHRALLPSMMVAMETAIPDAMADPRQLYRALRAYLMLDAPDHYDTGTVRAWIGHHWRTHPPTALTAEQRRMLEAHLDALLTRRPAPLPRALDAALIEEARIALANRPVAAQVYDSLRAAFPENQIEDFIPSRVLGSDGMLIFRRLSGTPLTKPLPGLYTHTGYHRYVAAASTRVVTILKNENWVLGERFAVTADQLQTLRQEVLTLYAKDYINHWQTLLGDVVLQPPRNLDHALEILKILSGPDSPLKRWLTAIARQTRLEPPTKTDSRLPAAPLPRPIAEIGTHFEGLHHQITAASEGGAAPIDTMLGQLNDIRVQMDTFDEALASGNPELVAQQSRRVRGALKQLSMALDRQPRPVADVLGRLAGNLKLMSAGGRRRYLDAMWKSEILPFCRRAIAGRYPVVSGSSRDIALADFARFFGPNGLMAGFFNQYLGPSVDRSRSPWRWNPHEGAVVSRQALRQFEIAEEIRNVFFGASARPLVRFSLEPISMSIEAVRGELDIDGQRLIYEHGPIQPHWFRWPGREAANVVHLRFLPPLAGRPSGITKSGPWAWLRLLDKGEVVKTSSSEQFLVTLKVGGRYLKLKLRASSAFNPFSSAAIHRFRCLPAL